MAEASSTPEPATSEQQKPAPLLFAEFLETAAPNSVREISDVRQYMKLVSGLTWQLNCPELQLHCPSAACGGLRFRLDGDSAYVPG